MVKIYMAICIWVTSFVVAKSRISPSVFRSSSCSTAVDDMAECVQFLSNGGKQGMPEQSCCSGFEKVLKSNPECICEALKTSSQLGVDIKASILAATCKISAPSIGQCGLSPPGGATAPSPSTSKGGDPSTTSPSPSPAVESRAHTLPACFLAPISMLTVSFSYIMLLL